MLNTDLCIDPVLAVVEKYKHHESIISINKKMREKGLPKFSFHFATLSLKEVALLSDKKSFSNFRYSSWNKENRDLLAYFILDYILYYIYISKALSTSEYPASLKYAKLLKRMTKPIRLTINA